ncbi:titin-like [Lingula anatina]|uniref:Titin-like n=1 Tax=Lingula anatina TaxID=7574 RepID=A0A1S3KAS6_LINAN|nr:titin-like [Lingula anatina]|eukprot:XP_013419361.1 titin-like [Lingula anatina]
MYFFSKFFHDIAQKKVKGLLKQIGSSPSPVLSLPSLPAPESAALGLEQQCDVISGISDLKHLQECQTSASESPASQNSTEEGEQHRREGEQPPPKDNLPKKSAPIFIVKMPGSKEEVRLGETKRFECQVVGFPRPEIRWFKDEVDITENPRYKFNFHDDGVISLLIENISAKDEGAYKCLAKNTEGTASTTAYLLVKVDKDRHKDISIDEKIAFKSRPLSIIGEEEEEEAEKHDKESTKEEELRKQLGKKPVAAPQFVEKPNDITVNEGETITITCKISGVPKPEVMWFKGGDPLFADGERIEIVQMEDEYTLTIKEAKPSDGGAFTVTASSTEGSVYYNVSVSVIAVKREKSPTPEREILEVAPEFIKQPLSQKIIEAEKVRFSCLVQGKPEPTVTWFKDGKLLKSDSHRKIYKAEGLHFLELPKASIEDGGEYTCTANNSAGAVYCNFALTVETVSEHESSADLDEQEALRKKKKAADAVQFKEYALIKNYTDQAKKIAFREGEIVQVLDALNPDSWLVRKKKAKEQVAYIPSEFLKKKDGVPDDKQAWKDALEEISEVKDRDRAKGKQATPELIETSSDDEKVAEGEKYPIYVAVADYIPPKKQRDKVQLTEGQFVEVLDKKNPEWWLVRTKPTKLHPAKQGWVPASRLEKRDGAGLVDRRNTREVFREDIIQITNKGQEANVKRRYALKELLESEHDYLNNLHNMVDTCIPPLEGADVPEPIKGKKDLIFANLEDIMQFHQDTFLPQIMACTSEPEALADLFLSQKAKLEEYIPYLKNRKAALKVLNTEPARKFTKKMKEKKAGEEQTLPELLKKPKQRLQQYQSVVKDFIRYTARAGADCSKLEEAHDMLGAILKQADDKYHRDQIEGYPGDLADLGNMVRHDDFQMWDAEPEGHGKDRHIFLFPDKLLITKKKKPAVEGELPTYIYKGIINLPDLQLNEDAPGDDRRFELWYAEPSVEKVTLQPKNVHKKQAWLKDLRELLTKLGVKETDIPDETLEQLKTKKPKVPSVPKKKPEKKKKGTDVTDAAPKDTAATSAEAPGLPPEDERMKPKFKKAPFDTKANEGDQVKFEIQVTGNPEPEITWFKGAQQIAADGTKYTFVFADDEFMALIVKDLKLSDAGLYYCRAKNYVGEAEVKIKLEVKGQKSKDARPSFPSKMRSNMNITEGNPVELKCTVAGFPEPDVMWQLNGKPLKPSANIEMKTEGDQAVLSIKNATPNDSGVYTCKITNKLGHAQCSSTVTVKPDMFKKKEAAKVAPTFTAKFKDVEVTPKRDTYLECKIKGSPAPEVTWYHNNKPLKDSKHIKMEKIGDMHILNIYKVTPEDEGEYTCKAVNTAGEVSHNARVSVAKPKEPTFSGYAPQFSKKVYNVDAVEGEKAKFECRVMGDPEPDVQWFKDGQPLQPGRKYKMEKVRGSTTLTISDVTKADAGEYTCTAANPGGKVSSAAMLDVQAAKPKEKSPSKTFGKAEEKSVLSKQPVEPVVEKKGVPPRPVSDKPTISKYTGDSLTLTWPTTTLPLNAIPTPITYSIESREPPIPSWTKVTSGLTTPKYTVTRLKPEKDYVFRVRAENQYGRSKPSPQATTALQKRPVPARKVLPPPLLLMDHPLITDLDKDYIRLKWIPSFPADAHQTYTIEMSEPPYNQWLTIKGAVQGTEYTLRDVRSNKDRMYRVRADGPYGPGEPSEPVSAKLFMKPAEAAPEPIPLAPHLFVDKIDNKRISLGWSPTRLPAYDHFSSVSYTVEVSKPPHYEWRPLVTRIKDTYLSIDLNEPHKDYYFRVRAENDYGISEPSHPIATRDFFKDRLEPSKSLLPDHRRPSEFDRKMPAAFDLARPLTLPELHHPGALGLGLDGRGQLVPYGGPDLGLDTMFTPVLPDTSQYRGLDLAPEQKLYKPPSVYRHAKFDLIMPLSSPYKGLDLATEVSLPAPPMQYKPREMTVPRQVQRKMRAQSPVITIDVILPGRQERSTYQPYVPQSQKAVKIPAIPAAVVEYKSPPLVAHTAVKPARSRKSLADKYKSDLVPYKPKTLDWDMESPERGTVSPQRGRLARTPSLPPYRPSLPSIEELKNRIPSLPSSTLPTVDTDIYQRRPSVPDLRRSRRPSVVAADLDISSRRLSVPDVGLTRAPSVRMEDLDLNVYRRRRTSVPDLKFDRASSAVPDIEEPLYRRRSSITGALQRRMGELPEDNTYRLEFEDLLYYRRPSVPDLPYQRRYSVPELPKRRPSTPDLKGAGHDFDTSMPTRRAMGDMDAPRVILDKPRLEDLGDGSIRITWTHSTLPGFSPRTPEIRYIIEVSEPPSKIWRKVIGALAEPNYVIKNLRPDQDYLFRVRAQNDYGVSEPSLPVSTFSLWRIQKTPYHPITGVDITFDKVPPRLSEKPYITGYDNHSLRLHWSPVVMPGHLGSPLVTYTIEMREPSQQWRELATGVNGHHFSVNHLDPEKDYMFRVIPVNEYGPGEPSVPVPTYLYRKRAPFDYRPSPDFYRDRRTEDYDKSRRWSLPYALSPWFTEEPSPAPPAPSRSHTRARSPSPSSLPSALIGLSSALIGSSPRATSVPPETLYSFDTSDINDYGAPPEFLPHKPTICDYHGDSFKLSWSPAQTSDKGIPSAITYIVECREPHHTDWRQLASNLTDFCYTVRGLDKNKDYILRVRPENEFGIGEPTLPVSTYLFRKPDKEDYGLYYKPRKAPVFFIDKPRVSRYDGRRAELSWSPPSTLPIYRPPKRYSYVVEFADPSLNDWKPLTRGLHDNRYVIRDLRPDKEYLYRIIAETERGVSEPTSPVAIKGAARRASLPAHMRDEYSPRSRSYSPTTAGRSPLTKITERDLPPLPRSHSLDARPTQTSTERPYAPSGRSYSSTERSYSPVGRSFTPVDRSYSPAGRSYSPTGRSYSPIRSTYSPAVRSYSPTSRTKDYERSYTPSPLASGRRGNFICFMWSSYICF